MIMTIFIEIYSDVNAETTVSKETIKLEYLLFLVKFYST